MADVRVYQARTRGVAGSSPDVRISQGRVFALINFPSEALRISQFSVVIPALSTIDVRLSQTRVRAVGRGRIENRRVRAWGYSLDAHDVYVLRLGEDETLTYDLSTGQWAEWNGGGRPYWRAHIGTEWVGIGSTTLGDGYPTNIVAGDDDHGQLWILDPEQGYDDPIREESSPQLFTRVVTGGVPMRMRDTARCNEIYLTMSLGVPAEPGVSITLRTSDDAGKTWADQGAIDIVSDDWTQEIVWRSLGLIQAPGRIFEVSDDGASARISSLEMR